MAEFLAAGGAALATGDWARARDCFRAALQQDESAEALDGMAEALFWLDLPEEAIRWRERAYVEFRRRGEARRAARSAMWLGRCYFLVHGNATAGNGWVLRAERMVREAGPCAERGWLELFRHGGSSDPNVVGHAAVEAARVAREFADRDLEALALAYQGVALVSAGRAREGMDRLDEAMASATAGEVKDLDTVGSIYCAMLAACEQVVDVQRAEEWSRLAQEFARRHCEHANPFAASCRTSYGAVLTATGRWAEAEHVLLDALRSFEAGHRAMRVDALVRLADLRIRQGRLAEARRLLQGYEEHPEAAVAVAALHLAHGEPALAAALLRRRLSLLGPQTLGAAPALALLLEAQAAQGDATGMRATVERLRALAARCENPSIAALADLASARAAGPTNQDAVPHLEAAIASFARVDMPLELARAKVALAVALGERDREVATAEARSALAAFERLGASHDADAAALVLRRLGVGGRTGPKTHGALTKREREVLELLGLGMTNERIAARLYLSRRTVEHHVSSILSKLDLETRAEAAAYAVRHATTSTSREPAATRSAPN